MLDNKKRLIKYIKDNLQIKISEKRRFGEVFTPMNFINDSMLHHMEKYYACTYEANIYENEKLT